MYYTKQNVYPPNNDLKIMQIGDLWNYSKDIAFLLFYMLRKL